MVDSELRANYISEKGGDLCPVPSVLARDSWNARAPVDDLDQMCGDMRADPVTLKCGHTVSKRCALATMKADCYECKRCGRRHGRAYIAQLKKNVVISALFGKLWKNQNAGERTDFGGYLPVCSQRKAINSRTPSTTTLLKEDSLVSKEDELPDAEGDRSYPNGSAEANRLHSVLDTFYSYMEDFSDGKVVRSRIDMSSLDREDFECSLCTRILWEPISTPCGHTFCRVCLNRCFDHQPTCPLCKASLADYLAERIQSTTEFLELAIRNLLPKEYNERKEMHREEMEEFSITGQDSEHVIPLFVCTAAFPTVTCVLHVFEPRYRLMTRQCMESGSWQFGMCAVVDNDIAEYGTMLEIRDVQYFPDGRSVVDTVGGRRFRILRKGERDGYSTGAVEFLKDEPLVGEDLQDLKKLHDQVHKFSEAWFMRLPSDTKDQILQHFGPMPEVEANYYSSKNGPSWSWWMLAILPIETRSQLKMLSMTSLPRRLKTLYKVLLRLQLIIFT